MVPVYAVKREGGLTYIAMFAIEIEANYYAEYLRVTYPDEKYHVYTLFQPANNWIAE